MAYRPFRLVPFRKMQVAPLKVPGLYSPFDHALMCVTIPPAIRMHELDFYYARVPEHSTKVSIHPLWKILGHTPPFQLLWLSESPLGKPAAKEGHSYATFTHLTTRSIRPEHAAAGSPLDSIFLFKTTGKTEDTILRTGILKMMQPSFSVKTFDDLMSVRALTGVTRITEHHLVNRQSTQCFAHSWLVNGVRKPDYEKIIKFLKDTGFFIEMRYDDPLGLATDIDSKGNMDVALNAFHISPTGLVKTLINVHIGAQLNVSVYQVDGEPMYIEKIGELISDRIVDKPIKLRYLSGFDGEGRPQLDIREIPKDTNRPLDCFYPAIPEGIVKLATDFEASPNNLLFMISEPGTGKSTLIREFCRIYKNRPYYQFAGDKVIAHPAFDTFLASLPPNAICIIEDAENLVSKRVEGNTTMALLLNEIDGIANKNIKFIISTNLENRKHVDEALFRPGRCFRTLEFSKLNTQEGRKICEEMGIDRTELLESGKIFTLAELLADGGDQKVKESGPGFKLN